MVEYKNLPPIFNTMVEYTPSKSNVAALFKALGDDTRLKIVTFLGQEGALRVSSLAARFDMSLNAVSKHIKYLESAGIVKRRVEGRDHFIELESAALDVIDAWIATSRNLWRQRLEHLENLLAPSSLSPKDEGSPND